jgi:hypothetical protein
LHQGLDNAPLAALPVLTKAMLLDRFDEVTTDPALRLDDLEAYWAIPQAGRPALPSRLVDPTHEEILAVQHGWATAAT